ncbi:MAG: hypothetical protein RMJ54_18940, partial [Roseiflexaceae bacterium]|nr:hypothetical protein [Roseiflexaceae bacterium]
STNPLLAAVQRWGAWVLAEARRELEVFYGTQMQTDATDQHGTICANPSHPSRSVSHSVGYIWARTIPCQNPACGVAIPLMR